MSSCSQLIFKNLRRSQQKIPKTTPTLQYNKIIDRHKIKYAIQIKPTLPVLNAQLRLHKTDILICQ